MFFFDSERRNWPINFVDLWPNPFYHVNLTELCNDLSNFSRVGPGSKSNVTVSNKGS